MQTSTTLGKSIVFVATDASRLHPLASIAADATISGSIAADLLGRFNSADGPVAMFTGDLAVQDHLDKVMGFAASLVVFSPHLRLLPTIETHEAAKMLIEAQRRCCPSIQIYAASTLTPASARGKPD